MFTYLYKRKTHVAHGDDKAVRVCGQTAALINLLGGVDSITVPAKKMGRLMRTF